jgi:hypothetical protein
MRWLSDPQARPHRRYANRPTPRDTELEQLQPGQLHVQVHYCGCSDRPRAHFPYQLVLLQTPKGDLVARPEHYELAVEFTTLAVRYGTRYCAVDEPDCYGSFEQPCDFTDFRYGPYLGPFFPTCKADEADAAAIPPSEESSLPSSVAN